jgi:hypothetical protein
MDAHANIQAGPVGELIPRLSAPAPEPGVTDLSSFLAQVEPPAAPAEAEAAQGPTADQFFDAINRIRDRTNDMSWRSIDFTTPSVTSVFDEIPDPMRYYQVPLRPMPQGMHSQFEILDDVTPNQVNPPEEQVYPNEDEGPEPHEDPF